MLLAIVVIAVLVGPLIVTYLWEIIGKDSVQYLIYANGYNRDIYKYFGQTHNIDSKSISDFTRQLEHFLSLTNSRMYFKNSEIKNMLLLKAWIQKQRVKVTAANIAMNYIHMNRQMFPVLGRYIEKEMNERFIIDVTATDLTLYGIHLEIKDNPKTAPFYWIMFNVDPYKYSELMEQIKAGYTFRVSHIDFSIAKGLYVITIVLCFVYLWNCIQSPVITTISGIPTAIQPIYANRQYAKPWLYIVEIEQKNGAKVIAYDRGSYTPYLMTCVDKGLVAGKHTEFTIKTIMLVDVPIESTLVCN